MKDDINKLDAYVPEFLQKTLDQNSAALNALKYHNSEHYRRQIESYGPPCRYIIFIAACFFQRLVIFLVIPLFRGTNTYKYERFNHVIKRSSHSFKNAPLQVAKFARLQTMKFVNCLNQPAGAILCPVDSGHITNMAGFEPNVQALLSQVMPFGGNAAVNSIRVYPEIRLMGTFYAPGLAVISNMPSTSFTAAKYRPKFTIIKHLLAFDGTVYAVMEKMKTCGDLSLIYHAFQIASDKNELNLTKLVDLQLRKAFSVKIAKKKQYVIVDCYPLK